MPAERDVEVVENRVSPIARLGQFMVVGSGVVFAIYGIIALIDAGIDSNLAEPVVTVWGHTHTAWLGIIELAVGVVLIGLGTSIISRRSAVVLGVLLIAAGIICLAIPEDLPEELAIDAGYGWWPLALGVVATVGALLPDGVTRVRTRRVERVGEPIEYRH
jgi:hypothetical protein